jgi:hypothetical protein
VYRADWTEGLASLWRGEGHAGLELRPPPAGVVVAHDVAGQSEQRSLAEFRPGCAPGRLSHGDLGTSHLAGAVTPLRAEPLLASAGGASRPTTAVLSAVLFAAQAWLLLYSADQVVSLRRAVDSRDLIGQAEGMLME